MYYSQAGKRISLRLKDLLSLQDFNQQNVFTFIALLVSATVWSSVGKL